MSYEVFCLEPCTKLQGMIKFKAAEAYDISAGFRQEISCITFCDIGTAGAGEWERERPRNRLTYRASGNAYGFPCLLLASNGQLCPPRF